MAARKSTMRMSVWRSKQNPAVFTHPRRSDRGDDDPNDVQKAMDDWNTNHEEDDCCICMKKLKQGKCVKNTNCKHEAHVACIEKWIKRRKTCPMCRKSWKSKYIMI